MTIKFKPLSASLFVLVLLVGCSEPQIIPDPVVEESATFSDSRESANARKQKTPLASFTIDGRTYEIEHDDEGRVVQINAIQNGTLWYSYKAYYENGRLSRADLVEDGQVMSSNANFVYNSDGNIISYDYVSFFYPEYPDGLVEPRTLQLNEDGQIAVLNGDALTYDKKGNVIQAGGTSYTYEKNANPFSLYENLWLILVEEPAFALLTLSPDVTSAVEYEDGTSGVYVNEYERKKKNLVSQVLVVNGNESEVIRFSY